MIDALTTLIEFLKDDSNVFALAGERIYGEELPRTLIEKKKPQKIVLIEEAGGIENNRFLPIAQPRFDVWSYGETFHEAGKLDRAIYDAFKVLDRRTIGGALLHNASLSGGPFNVRNNETGWPAKWRAITIKIDERTIA